MTSKRLILLRTGIYHKNQERYSKRFDPTRCARLYWSSNSVSGGSKSRRH